MITAALVALSLQLVATDGLAGEGERLGRLSTLFAVCEPYYAVDIEAGRRLADAFERRSAAAGWTAVQRSSAYDRGRDLERAEVGIVMDATGVTRAQARSHLRQMYPRLKRRCQDLAREVPGAVADVEAGDLRLDAAARPYGAPGAERAQGAPTAQVAHPATPQQFAGRQSAYVQGTLNVATGERATLRLNADGSYDLVDVDRIQVRDVLPPAEGSRDQLNRAAAGTIRFGLHARQDVGSILKVENGQGQGLKYFGLIVRYVGGQARGPVATSVCTVPPGMATFEHWPEPVIQVVIGGLQRSDDAVPTCPPHVED
ncbi:hypothetical protein [Brevundimonas sp.]|uniref:hypothetical protein n=1 Tax=Brevundimonas sp. TaxID=1871086 RepID=UPI0035688513